MINVRIPWQVWASGAIIAALLVSYKLGQRDVRRDWDEAKERGERIVRELQDAAGKVTIRVEERVVYRDRVIEKQGKIRTVVREVFVPTDSGSLSGGFRLYHDAAATDTIPDATAIPDATPVAIADVTDTIEYNYQLCHKAYAKVEAWQQWVDEQARISAEAAK